MKAIHWTQLVISFFLSDVLILDVHGSSDVVVDLHELYIYSKNLQSPFLFQWGFSWEIFQVFEVSYVSSSVGKFKRSFSCCEILGDEMLIPGISWTNLTTPVLSYWPVKSGYQVCETQTTPVLALFESRPPQKIVRATAYCQESTLQNARKAHTFFSAFSCCYMWDVFLSFVNIS